MPISVVELAGKELNVGVVRALDTEEDFTTALDVSVSVKLVGGIEDISGVKEGSVVEVTEMVFG